MKEAKERFLNLIMDNGVSLSLSVAFCFAIYYIVHSQNIQLMLAIEKLREDKKDLIEELIECYKLKE